MPEIAVIPTQYKTKLPHTLSYPLGAEALSAAFTDVPQFSDMTVRFWFYSKKTAQEARHTTYCRLATLEVR
jgi:hypothetical protein